MVKGDIHDFDLGHSSIGEHKRALDDGVLAMTRALGAETYLIIVIGDGHIARSVSPDLKPYERGFVAEVEKARANQIVVCHPGAPGTLRRAEEALGRTKHTELHPIVAVLIESLNKMNGVRVSRSTALKDSSALPGWWPHGPKKYAERMQQLTIKDLTVVVDSIFTEVRGDVPRVEKLWAMLSTHFKTGSCSIPTRAVFDAYFEFLLNEALAGGNAPIELGNGCHEASANADSSPSNGKEGFPLDLNVDVVPGQLQMSNAPGNALGNLLSSATSGFQAVAPRNVHRPQPTRPQPMLKHVPEFTKQELRVTSTVDDAPRSANLGRHGSPMTHSFMGVNVHQAASTAEVLTRSLFTPQEYADSEAARKRPRVDVDFVDLAWSRGNESGTPTSSTGLSFLSSLVAPAHAQTAKAISGLLRQYDTPEGASHEGWRRMFEEASRPGVQSTAHNEPFARSTDHNGPASHPTVANVELPLLGPASSPASFPASYPVTEKGESTADAQVEVVAETRDPTWKLGGGRCLAEWTQNRRSNAAKPEDPAPRPVQAAPADARLLAAVADARRPAASADPRLPDASDVLAALVRSPPPSEALRSAHVSSSRLRDDLASVVGTLVRGLARISSSKSLRSPTAVPEWFPFPQHYPNFTETLGKEDLKSLLDIVFRKVRGEYFHIRELRTQWDTSRGDVSNSAMRAKIEVYFNAIEAEAAALIPKGGGRRSYQNSPKDVPMGGADLQL